MDEVTLKFKGSGRGNYKNQGQGYLQAVHSKEKKRKQFGIKIYKLCDESGHTYDMRVYLGRHSNSATDDMTATHATVRHLTSRVGGLGHTYLWTISFHPQDFLMTWTHVK